MAVWLVLWALTAVAASAKASEEPASAWNAVFHLETIRVEGLRQAKPDLLLAEARLAAGERYDEAELGRAIDRIRRLPFVRDAAFSLSKGSRRGSYELVITVEETRRFFFGTRLQSTDYGGVLNFDPGPTGDESSDATLLIGMRLFTGRYGTAFLAVEEDKAVAGYSRNQLFGRPISLQLGYDHSLTDLFESRVFGASIDPGFGRWIVFEPRAVTAAVSIPVGDGDRFGMDVERRWSDVGIRSLGLDFRSVYFLQDLTDDRLTATWLRDSTDDAVFASRGIRLVGSLGYRQVRADLPGLFGEGDIGEPVSFDSRSLRLAALGGRWWPLGNRQTVWATAQLAAATTQVDGLPIGVEDELGSPLPRVPAIDESYQSAEISVGVGHRLRLGSDSVRSRLAAGRDAPQELYWETTVQVSRDEAFGAHVGGVLEQIDARTGLVWRTSWGVFRFGFRYVDASQSL